MYVDIEAFQQQLLFAPPSILELIMHCNGKSHLHAVMLLIINTCYFTAVTLFLCIWCRYISLKLWYVVLS
jgi:hypothetical protein